MISSATWSAFSLSFFASVFIPFKELSAQPIDSIEEVAKVGDTLELVVIKQIKENKININLSFSQTIQESKNEYNMLLKESLKDTKLSNVNHKETKEESAIYEAIVQEIEE